jgi:signal transduction histidine kinase
MEARPDPFTSYVLASPRDGSLTCQFLRRGGLQAVPARCFAELVDLLVKGPVGVAVLAEEMMPGGGLQALCDVVARQPPWSDLPFVAFTTRRSIGPEWKPLLEVASVTLLERPVQSETMLAAVRSALRSRRRQYQMRDLMATVEEANRSLAEHDRRKDEFLAMLGHELRNPLAVVTNAAFMLRTADSPGTIASQRDVIERQTRSLNRLVDDLLDVSRVTMGKIALQRELVDLRQIASRCVEALEAVARQQRQTLAFTTRAAALFVDGDVIRLEQVLSNLVTNALKYTPEGGRIDVVLQRRSFA